LADHDFFKKSSIFSCFPASDFSHNSRCTNEVTHLGQILSSPFHSSSTSHIILYSSFSLPLSISQQLIHIKASAINLNQSTSVQHIKKRLDFLNLHIIRNICTSTTNFYNFKVFCPLYKRGDKNGLEHICSTSIITLQ
jgi:hypothetical protein